MKAVWLALGTALATAFVAGPAAAEADYYDVEIVIFAQPQTPAGVSERWRPEVVVPRIADAAAFDTTGPRAERLRELPEGFERLPPEQSQLGGAVERLEASGRYRVLRHVIWRQPSLGPEKAIALRLSAGEPMIVRIPASAYPAPPGVATETGSDSATESEGMPGESPDESTGESTGSEMTYMNGQRYLIESPFGLGMVTPPMREARILPLDGTVKLVVSRYLHLHTNLYYTTAVEWTEREQAGAGQATAAGTAKPQRIIRGPNGQALLSYPFQQERRMRSGELHYLDHPVLGLLVKVTPYEDGEGTGEEG